MQRSSTFHFRAVAHCILLALFSISGCSDSGTGLLGYDDPADGDGLADADTSAEPSSIKAGLDNPPIAVGAFFDGVFPPRTPNSPGTSTWDVVAAFPALNLGDTLVITANPSNNRLYVGARDGLIRSFDNQPDVTTADTFLDLRDRVAVVWDGGFLGLIFHPEFGVPGSPNRNYFYVFYSSHCPLNGNRDAIDLGACDQNYPQGSTGGFFNTYLRLSRYEVPDGSTTADPASERIMVNIRLYNGSHRSGGMVFRNDGYLHVTIGDQFHYETAQDIVDTLEGGSMRFAVDVTDNGDGTWTCPPGSHLPRRIFDTFDEISGQWYCIPDDNPWLDPGGGVFEEYCSIGHRNPHRLTWDPVTDYMWSGEVGENTREEINVIFCGNNYGWPFREGLTTGPRSEPSSYLGTLTDPVIDFVRSEARAIIGGYVYRGSTFAELYGLYLTGDYVTGNIWAITLDESTMTATKQFLTVFDPGGLGTFGQDNDGEVYLGDVINGGTLYTLDRIGQSVPDPPALLSATGAFSDMLNVVPDSAWVPYALNQPFWSDGADKSRWIAVPNDGLRDTASEQIAFSETADWSFPIGTVLMKHFELPIDETDPSITDRLETRFYVHGDDGEWYGLTYRWRPDETDADLLVGAETSLHTISLAAGGTRDQTWNYPSRFDCNACHRSIGVLGPRTHQLNGDFTYPSTSRTDNQLATWNDLGMFTPALVEANIPTMIRSKALGDVTGSLQDRARSWLDSNCSNCHRPGEIVAGFDMRYTVPFEAQGLVWGPVRDDLGMVGTAVIVPGDPDLSAAYKRMEAVGSIAMPPLAKELAEQSAVDLMGEWILRIDPGTAQPGVDYEYWETAALSVLPDFDALGTPDEVGTASTFDISVANRGDDFALRFQAFLGVNTGGDYTFYTSSDDGSKLYIDGAEIVDNDGLHGNSEQSGGPITLAAGYYAIEVTMFERGGLQALTVSWNGPDTGNTKQLIGTGELYLEIPAQTPNDPPTLQTPADQANSSGESVVLDLVGNDTDGDLLYFDASDLPDGLSVDHLTGQIAGTLNPSGPGGTYGVTASVSDGPDVAAVNFDWIVGDPSCGNGTLEVGEECDDGNNANGDGCASDCTIEVTQVCGDGVVTPPETCEPPGTDTCNDSCTSRVPVCGDGFLTPPEACEDGNTVDGDGCSSACLTEGTLQDVTANGAIISFTTPTGSGNPNPEVIRDGDKPLVGNANPLRQFDTYDGGAPATEDWIGYTFSSDQVFTRLVFQEGMNFSDGGWFDTLTVQVRQGGTWVEVANLSITPAYTFGNGVNYETFTLDFDPISGDGIRLYGAPGGSADFISVGELEVYALVLLTCGNGVLDQGEECDDGNLVSNDGCTASCVVEFCGDGTVNNITETCEPPGTADCNDTCTARVPVCGDGFVTSPETCEDGNTVDGDGCSSACQVESAGQDLTDLGTIIARVIAPLGGGNHDPETIRDGDFPPVGSTADSRQFDTWDGFNTSPDEWIGYSYPSDQTFGKVTFQEGKHFFDGGWFDSLTVQARQGGVWNEVTGLAIVPTYPGNNGVNYETFEMTFDPATGDGIRIYGAPGGSADFISVGELEIYAPSAPSDCGNGVLDGGEECDDGNTASGDGCSGLCVAEFCGDGTVNNVTETCEPPGTDDCNDTCTDRVPLCGDGFLTSPEGCDDGNTADGDGCASDCTVEDDGSLDSLNMYHIGNSLTDIIRYQDFQGLVESQGKTRVWGRHVIAGAPIQWIWDNPTSGFTEGPYGLYPNALNNYQWDVVTIQPFDRELASDVQYGGQFFDLALAQNPNTQLYVYMQWPRSSNGTWDSQFLATGTPDNDIWSREFYELVALGISANHPAALPVLVVPVGEVMHALKAKIDASQVPGFADVWDLYIDDVHLNDTGSYLVAATFYSTLYKADPRALPTTGWIIDPTVAQIVRDTVWEVVPNYPLSGVLNTCGNGTLEGSEECDDGNVADDDGCSARCVIELCGDGIVNNGETCEPPSTATCTDTCTDRAPLCGDGFVTAPEQCDDGNTADGDGCDSSCNTEIPAVCGDAVVTPPETCEPPNTATCSDTCSDRVPLCGDTFVTPPETCEPPNTAVCNGTCTARVPLCGDLFITPPETCDDGNTADGDGCSSTCETETPGADLTDTGTIIGRVLAPLGGGNHDPETIRDNDKPPVGSVDDARQFDTWDGGNTSPDEWIGYSYPSDQLFGKVVFQEGKHFFDGGWFDSLTVQVRQGGVWNEVTGLSTVPVYPGNNAVNFETFEMTFAPAVGDAIRIYGAPGGSADFVSVGELEVFAPGVVTCGNGSLDGSEECDDGNVIAGDGCGPTCLNEFCGDGVINNNGTETCEPPGTADCALDCTARVPVCGDGFITPPETCEDGNTNDGDGCSSQCLLEDGDLTDVGTIIAAVPNPQGGGNHDPETIRDDDFPPVGSADDARQFDTWDGGNVATEDWIGYTFPSQYSFNRVVFQEGKHFFDGGWFDTLTVQVRQGGTWVGVTGLVSTPTYAGNNGIAYETYELTFDPAIGDGIRIFGAPGGSADFISVGELEVYGATP